MLKCILKKSITFLFFLIVLIIIISVPREQTAAAENNKYLVIVGAQDGTFTSYDNLAVEINGSLLVKAKPLAAALGIQYNNSNGNKKGCILINGTTRIVYTRNSRNYKYITADKTETRVAEYKQCYLNNYNLVHYQTVGSLVNCSYFSANQAPEYSRLGYAGVIVYNNSMPVPTLPSALSVVMPGQSSTLPISKEQLFYFIERKSIYDNEYFTVITCSFRRPVIRKIASLDFTELLKAYSTNGFPSDGIYGYGYCDSPLTLQAVDRSGNIISEYTTMGDTFLLDFPAAVKLNIACREVATPSIAFTPVKPIIITDTTKIAFADIPWLTASDGYSKQFFVLAKGLSISNKYETQKRFYHTGDILYSDLNFYNNINDFYQVVSFVTKYNKALNSGDYLSITKDETPLLVDNSLVRIYDKNKNLWAVDFEQKLNDMIKAIKDLGVPNYLTKSSCEKTVTIRVDEFSASPSTNKDYITLPPSIMKLDCTRDYLSVLHELITFYYVQEVHYSTNNYLLYRGIPEVLSRQVLSKLNINVDSTISPLTKITISSAEQTKFIDYFQTPFENRNIGYYLISYLQKTYGNDIISKISTAEASADIPIKNADGAYRDKDRDMKFYNCIKSVTSENVISDFMRYYSALP